MREVQGEHIYRTLIETKDFAAPSDENVGEIHHQIALKRRGGSAQVMVLSQAYDVFNVIEAGSSFTAAALQIQAQVAGNTSSGLNIEARNNAAIAQVMNDLQPILFEEVYVKSLEKIKQLANSNAGTEQSNNQNEYNYKGVHLFIMVHGFQGNACDMRLLKNNIALLFPEAMFLCSSANEEFTEGDIFEMGVRLS